MDFKKRIDELSIEDLLAISSGENLEKFNVGTLNEAEHFIKSNNVKEGEVKVYAIVIYDTYVKWKGGRKKALPKHMFFRLFSKIFNAKRAWNGRYYLLNGDSFDTSKENFKTARKRYRHKKRKKKARRGTKEGSIIKPESKPTKES